MDRNRSEHYELTASASDNHLPPMMIIPRVQLQHHFLFGAMPSTKGCAAKSGWMNVDLFVDECLDNLIAQTICSKSNLILLILNNYGYVSIQALQKAKDNGIALVTIPPHLSHKLQPLDVSVYYPFKEYFAQAMDDWMRRNPGGVFVSVTLVSLSDTL